MDAKKRAERDLDDAIAYLRMEPNNYSEMALADYATEHYSEIVSRALAYQERAKE